MAPSSKLPTWAHVSLRVDSTPLDGPSLQDEESYLRTRVYELLCQRIDESVDNALNTSLGKVADELKDYFQLCLPDSPSADSEPAPNPYVVLPPQRFCHTLLPLAYLKGSESNMSDRRELTTRLASIIKQKMPSSIVCHLQIGSSLTTKHCGPLMEQILQQCLLQEGNSHRPSISSRTSSKERQSMSEHLLHFASRALAKKSITVLVEETENISLPMMQDFVQLLAELRQCHGLPVQLAVLQPCSHGPNSYPAGVMVRSFRLPPPKAVLETVWREASDLPPSVLSEIHSSFLHQHQSFVKTAILLKQALAQQMSRVGSALHPILLIQDDKLLAWFCLHPGARQEFLGTRRSGTKQALVEKVREKQLAQIMVQCFIDSVVCLSGLSWIKVAESLADHGSMQKVASRTVDQFKLSHMRRKETVLSRLSAAATRLEEGKSLVGLSSKACVFKTIQATAGNSTPELDSMMASVCELIVVFDSALLAYDVYESPVVNQMWLSLEEIVLALLRKGSDAAAKCLEMPCDAYEVFPHHRRSVLNTLLSDDLPLQNDKTNTSTTRILYRLISNAVSVSRQEWFQRYKNWTQMEDKAEVLSMFALGIYQLIQIGLIREKIGFGARSSDTIYEKVALVWCS